MLVIITDFQVDNLLLSFDFLQLSHLHCVLYVYAHQQCLEYIISYVEICLAACCLLLSISPWYLKTSYNIYVLYSLGKGKPHDDRLYEMTEDANACSAGVCVFRIDEGSISPKGKCSTS